MPKVLVTALLIVFALTMGYDSLSAQYASQSTYPSPDRRNEFSLGVKVGANLSRLYDAETNDFVADPKVGYAAGVFATIPLTTMIGIQPEVLKNTLALTGGFDFALDPQPPSGTKTCGIDSPSDFNFNSLTQLL